MVSSLSAGLVALPAVLGLGALGVLLGLGGLSLPVVAYLVWRSFLRG